MHRTLLLLVTMLAATPPASAEQQIVTVAPGAHVRVSSPALPASPIEGDAVAIDGGALTFRSSNRESVLTVQAERIERLEIHGKSHGHAGMGAAIGGVMGGLLGLMAGVAASNDSFASGDMSSGQQAEGTVMLGFLGGAVGAGVGALFGSAMVTRDWIALTPEQVEETFAQAVADSSATPR